MRQLITAVFLAASACLSPVAAMDLPSSSPRGDAFVQGNTAFALELYRQLRQSEPANLFFSPYSISVALGMTYAGACGNTQVQMANALHFPRGQEVHEAFGATQKTLAAAQRSGAAEFSFANSLWAQQGHPFGQEFLERVQSNYEATLEQVDFTRAYDAARRQINDWAAEKTRDRIRELLGPLTLDEHTRLVLVNTIYFKSAWEHPFEAAATREAPFRTLGHRSVEVDMMSQQHRFRYAEDDSLQVLELPYVDGGFSMLILLPGRGVGLDAVEDRLTPDNLERWLEAMRYREVEIYLPKFRFEDDFELSAALQSLGMEEAFTWDADFSAMDGTRELSLSKVLHGTFVAVDEQGTEAAAATAVVVEFIALPPETPKVFRADRPFVFLIRERETDSILFIGRFADPEAGGSR